MLGRNQLQRSGEMESYKEISFLSAMIEIAEGRIKSIYYKNSGDIVPIENYNITVRDLKQKQYFLKEVKDS